MDPNNNHFNNQNYSNYPFNYENPNNYPNPNQFFNQRPQNIPNFGFPPNFNQSSSVPNFHPYYGSMMRYPSQTPPFNGSMPMENDNFHNVGATQYPEFSTQITPRGMAIADEVTPEDSTPKSKRSKEPAWNTQQNLVLISAWIKYGTSSVVGRNQRGETYWGKIAEYCNEYCSFDSPRDLVACRNRFNYMSKIINKWIGAYESAKRMQGSGWSEDDVLTKAQELFAGGKNIQFTLNEEWHALRDQPRYGSQMGGNVGSGSSGSKRSHEDSVGSSARPMGREAAKKKGKMKSKGETLEKVEKEWVQFKELKEQEIEQLKELNLVKQQKNKLLQEKTQAKKMKMYLKLRDEEHLDDRKKELLEKLERELFEN
ncbi:hypothetical protein MTR_1g471070 [Medicago truncatula]|uniref:No apical meristem-associated C-terminal domain-containing protein n=1 Tax=Medicago truncatula TaxID=3880 RepID=A0A072VKR7_MEDTR|nr:hypothetical protein MTR_3g450670 [Medicago truncatula]KEH42624.1 hypothetical protein MTR_1g471070 [Medicago truncatula]